MELTRRVRVLLLGELLVAPRVTALEALLLDKKKKEVNGHENVRK